MQKKIVIVAALVGLASPCFAYNDYGYSYGIATPYSGGFDASMHLREMQNDFNRQYEQNAASMHATMQNNLNSSSQRIHTEVEQQPQPAYNSNRDYVQDKPLYIFGR